jgi:hypothetical protein
MRNFKIGDIVKVKMLQNAYYGSHRGQNAIIPVGTIGKVMDFQKARFNYAKNQESVLLVVVFYVKKTDINKHKWKECTGYQLDTLERIPIFYNIYKITHDFQKKELTRANEKEAERFKEMEENYLSIKLAEKI